MVVLISCIMKSRLIAQMHTFGQMHLLGGELQLGTRASGSKIVGKTLRSLKRLRLQQRNFFQLL